MNKFSKIEKNYRLSKAFWLYQYRVKYAPFLFDNLLLLYFETIVRSQISILPHSAWFQTNYNENVDRNYSTYYHCQTLNLVYLGIYSVILYCYLGFSNTELLLLDSNAFSVNMWHSSKHRNSGRAATWVRKWEKL